MCFNTCFFSAEEFIYLFVCFGSYSWRWLVLSWHPGSRCRSRRCIRTSRTALWWCLSVASVVLPSRISAGLQEKERRNVYRCELPAGNGDLETESSTDCWRVKPTDGGTNVSAAPSSRLAPNETLALFSNVSSHQENNRILSQQEHSSNTANYHRLP